MRVDNKSVGGGAEERKNPQRLGSSGWVVDLSAWRLGHGYGVCHVAWQAHSYKPKLLELPRASEGGHAQYIVE
jgi:hypothetical protein